MAMIFGATRSSSATALSSTFKQLDDGAGRLAARRALRHRHASSGRARARARRRRGCPAPGFERSKPFGIERSRPSASTERGAETARSITASSLSTRPRGTSRDLRLALAPGRDLHQDRDLARLAHAPGEPPPGVLGLGPVGLGRGEHRHLLVEPAVASVRLKLRLQRLVDRDQVGDVGQRVGELRLGERPARPVGEARRLVDASLGEVVDELLVGNRSRRSRRPSRRPGCRTAGAERCRPCSRRSRDPGGPSGRP